MALFGYKIVREQKKSEQRITHDLQTPFTPQFFMQNQQLVWKQTGSQSGITEALEECPIVSTIINKEIEAFNNGISQIINKKSGKPAQGENKQYLEVLAKPNKIQTQSQFEAQIMGYTLAYGYCIVIFSMPVGFGVQNMWVLPPKYTKINVKRNYNPFEAVELSDWIESIELKIGDKGTKIDLNRAYLFKDSTIPVSSPMLPQSRLTPLSKPITSLLAVYTSENEMLLHRGPRGILANTAAGDLAREPMSKETRHELNMDFKNAYGLMPDQSQVIITDAALQWQSMSFNAEELGLDASYKRAVFDIATGLSYPKDLLQLEGSTFNNQDAALKSLYQDMVIPYAKSYCEQMGSLLGLDNTNLKYIKDYSHLSVFQESEKERGEGLKAMTEAAEMQFNLNAITYNQMLEMIGQEPRPGMDKYKYELTEIYGQTTNQNGGGQNSQAQTTQNQ